MVKGFDILQQRPRAISQSRIISVVERDSPLVVSVPHGGTWIPEESLKHVEHSQLLLLDTDLYTQTVYRDVMAVGSSVTSEVNPYITNLNRGFTKPELPIVAQQLLSGQATLLHPYTPAEQRRLVARFYNPYHEALARLIKRAVSNFGYAIMFDVNSMDRHGMVHTKDPGEVRPDMVVGDNLGKSADHTVIEAVEAHLKEAGYHVARNKPYSGGHITKAYGNPAKRVHALQIELVKELYMYGIATEQELVREPLLKQHYLTKLQQTLKNALLAAVRAGAVA